MTDRDAGAAVRNRRGGRAGAVGAADVYNILTQMTTPGVTCVVTDRALDRADGDKGRSVETLLATVRAKRDAVRLLGGLHDAKRRAEQRERGHDHVPIFQAPAVGGDVLGHGDASDAHGGLHRGREVPTCSFDGERRPLLEQLARITAQDLAAGLPRPKENESLAVAVELRLDDERSRVCVVTIETYRSGFGRPWLARCPRCGRRVRLLYVVPADDGLVCDVCTGSVRYSVRVGHRRWYRSVIRHLRRSAGLHDRASRRRIRHLTRERFLTEALAERERALAGLEDLGIRSSGTEPRPAATCR